MSTLASTFWQWISEQVGSVFVNALASRLFARLEVCARHLWYILKKRLDSVRQCVHAYAVLLHSYVFTYGIAAAVCAIKKTLSQGTGSLGNLDAIPVREKRDFPGYRTLIRCPYAGTVR